MFDSEDEKLLGINDDDDDSDLVFSDDEDSNGMSPKCCHMSLRF